MFVDRSITFSFAPAFGTCLGAYFFAQMCVTRPLPSVDLWTVNLSKGTDCVSLLSDAQHPARRLLQRQRSINI